MHACPPGGRLGGHDDAARRPSAPAFQLHSREAELTTIEWLRSLGLHTVDHPRTPTFSTTGHAVEPDLGLRLGTGGAVFHLNDGPIDVIGEVKVQTFAGTAIDKLHESIDRYANLVDIYGVPAVIFYDFDVEAVGAEVIDRFARFADLSLIGFVAVGSVDAAQLRSLVGGITRRRQERVGDDQGLLDILAALGPHRVAAAARLAARRDPVTVNRAQAALW